MDARSLIAQIDAEIEKLTRARAALAAINSPGTSQKRRGRPPKNLSAAPVVIRKRRELSAEARAKIAAAQRKRWAAQRKAAKKTA